MRNLVLFVLFFLQFISNVYAGPCEELYSNLAGQLNVMVPALTWIDINPMNASPYCQFVIRYFPCNTDVQHQIDAHLPLAIQSASKQCRWLSQGSHVRVEGYCVLQNVLAEYH